MSVAGLFRDTLPHRRASDLNPREAPLAWTLFSRDRDKVLVQACIEGRPGAFESLVELYQPVVTRHVTYLLHQYSCGRMIAGHREEIIQQIWAGLIEQIAKFPADEFPAWFALYRRWKTLDYLRSEFRYSNRHLPAEEHAWRGERDGNPSRPSPEDACQNKQDRLRILGCMEQIPEKHREFIRLYYFEGWSYERIASHYGIGQGSVGSLHTRAVRRLRKVFVKKKSIKK
jgi:RNA polymerase sigma factor (sigma-70 family)